MTVPASVAGSMGVWVTPIMVDVVWHHKSVDVLKCSVGTVARSIIICIGFYSILL